ncbi:hypothetical protein RRG08_059901 [Elysia crispata]|uniref:Tetraspanin n=1 Tax=Elysia crispata TaxID=231223 RepID=A0AAE0Y6G6_9GAST|nr:hypothetical protein RRG08_059901 [Elysia crispata]
MKENIPAAIEDVSPRTSTQKVIYLERRSVWDDPPDLSYGLYLTLLPILIGCSGLSVVGIQLDFNPRVLLRPYLESSSSSSQNVAYHQICRNGTMDFCPTEPGVDTALVLPKEWFSLLTRGIGYVGLCDFVICVISGLSACTSSTKTLFSTLFLIPLAIAAKWKLVDLIVFDETPMHEWAKDQLVQTYRAAYEVGGDMRNMSELVTTMNTIMIKSGCCGIRGPADFMFQSPIALTDSWYRTHYFQYPPACCVRTTGATNTSHLLSNIMNGQCVSNQLTWAVNEMGCFSTVFHFTYNYWGKAMLGIVLTLIFMQSAQTIFTILVLLKRKKIRRKSGRLGTSSRNTILSECSDRVKRRSQLISRTRSSTID